MTFNGGALLYSAANLGDLRPSRRARAAAFWTFDQFFFPDVQHKKEGARLGPSSGPRDERTGPPAGQNPVRVRGAGPGHGPTCKSRPLGQQTLEEAPVPSGRDVVRRPQLQWCMVSGNASGGLGSPGRARRYWRVQALAE
ncbi:hypothetical protein ON010_g18768 [Phytophthora cinnamomi]|nr:hypothetical protein ON010_g18768 [Phytophthora cinnamomi]